jgi:hypothetical protein
MMVRKVIMIMVFVYVFSVSAFTQAGENHDSYENSFSELQNFYEASIATDNRFINGSLYAESFPGSRGHPFFQSETWFQGELLMEGRIYHEVAVRYDLYRDQLLYNHIHSTGSYVVILNKKRIESFTLEGHRFCKLPNTGHLSDGVEEGYYELLSEGKATFYVKWMKRLSDPSPQSPGEFTLFNEWYIQNNGKIRKVSRRSGLLHSLNDHEKEIREYIRENRIVIQSGNEPEIKRIVDYYNRLEP